MGGTSFDPTGTNPASATLQQGMSVGKPSLWDTWTQKAYSLRPLGNMLGQVGDNLEQRGINMLHGDGFKTDAQVYPPPLPPQALAARPPTNIPVRGGIGPTQNLAHNDQGNSLTPGQMSPYSRACVLAGLRGMVRDTEGMNLLPDGGYGSFLAGGKVIANPRNLDGIRLTMNSSDARIADPAALPGHPHVDIGYRKGQEYKRSDAFGAYQILGATARDRRYTDFSHAGQDAAANDLIENRRHMLAPAMQGDWTTVFRRGSPEWASLPGDHYRQGAKSPDEALAAYNRAIQSAPECK